MAKTGGAVRKLQDKASHRATRLHRGTFKPLMNRIDATYHDKARAFAEYKLMLSPVDAYGNEKTAVRVAAVFEGSGLPDEVTAKPPKTNAERAAADKRAPLKSEWKEGFRPRRWKKYA